MRGGNFKTFWQFSGILGRLRQFALKPGIRHRQHRRDRLGIRFSPDIGNAVLSDKHVAQMPRNGLMAIAPADIGLRASARPPRRLQREDRACAVQRKGLRHEIILAADAADDLAVFQPVRHRSPHQGRHHRIVDEARVDARPALGVLVTVERVGEGYRHHLDARDLRGRHLAQRAVKRLWPKEECAVQDHAIDLALQDAGVDQA